MCHFIPTRKIILHGFHLDKKKQEQKIIKTSRFFEKNVLMERCMHSGKLELCKAVIKNGGKQQRKMDPKKKYGGRELKNEAQFFALLAAYYHFHFRPCWPHKVFGTHVFLYFLGPMQVFPFFTY